MVAPSRYRSPGDPAIGSTWQLVSITIDPEHDRPAILRAYGQPLGADLARWRFVTGEAAAITELTKRFAVRTERNRAHP